MNLPNEGKKRKNKQTKKEKETNKHKETEPICIHGL